MTEQEEAAYYQDLINRLLATHKYEWARETLVGIATTISLTDRVTLRQKSAVDHIMVGRLKHDSSAGT
jgi:hypothetical protein